MSVKIGDRITFRPEGWENGKEYAGVSVPSKVTGTVTYVSKHLCVVEAEVDGRKIRESFGLYKGELRP